MKEVKSGDDIVVDNLRSSGVYWDEVTYETISQYSKNSKDWRNFFWNYPKFILKLLNVTRPFSFLLIYIAISFHIFNYFTGIELVDGYSNEKEEVLVEGSLGHPDNLNPLFISQNPIEKDLNSLIYQKFINIDEKGKPQPGIAVKWETEDNKKYKFTLRRNIKFHDGEVLTAEDVVYTFNTGKQLSKIGVDSIGIGMENIQVKAISRYEVEFTLPEINSTFFEVISVYIIPEHYFNEVEIGSLYSSRLNESPIGSGPYMVQDYDQYGIILKASDYYSPTPNIESYEMRFFDSYKALEVAYQNNLLNAVSHLGYYGDEFRRLDNNLRGVDFDIITRKKVVFMNTREDKLKSSYLREALNYLVDKEELIRHANIDGEIVYGPIHKESWAYSDDFEKYKYSKKKVEDMLFQAGYVKNKENGYFQDKEGKILSLDLYYLDNKLNQTIAEELSEQFEEHGIILDIDQGAKSYGVITREVIATRSFELLLYEVESTLDPDQYNLWHSLKISYPNLNLVGTTEKSERIDILLERARTTNQIEGENGRKEQYKKFQKYLMSDSPAIFLYRPTESYFIDDDVEVDFPQKLRYYHNRFDNIEDWSLGANN